MSRPTTLTDSNASESTGNGLTARRSVIAVAIAAIVGSLCCVGPLVLLLLGISGAWIGYLTAMQPYSPIFIAVALVFGGLAFRKLYLVRPECAPDGSCVTPPGLRNQRIAFWVVTVLAAALLSFKWYAPLLLT